MLSHAQNKSWESGKAQSWPSSLRIGQSHPDMQRESVFIIIILNQFILPEKRCLQL
jgi:hypothetical protein